MNDLHQLLVDNGKLIRTENGGSKLTYLICDVEFTYFTQTEQVFRNTLELKQHNKLQRIIENLIWKDKE